MARGRGLLMLVLILIGLGGLEATQRAPKVHVYSRHPVENGKSNILNCYVEEFHPPNIEITLLKNGVKMDAMEMSDLSFSDDWTFQRLVHAPFTPNGQDSYECQVVHSTLTSPKKVRWDPDY
ncbi:beta-2-microglobulin [Gopherus flavomarginatus]|uniref:beta-2-microglobulin n=1 Tax=Gopherus flavomarginatus TaxID=286002 RepID=UPI0021CC1C3C|nr:beta-2-microglobulin [Gopherus flavomarginatus]